MKKAALGLILLLLSFLLYLFFLTPDKVDVLVDGRQLEFEEPVMEKEGRYFLPALPILEAIGFETDFDIDSGMLLARIGSFRIVLTAGSRVIVVDGRAVQLDKPVELVDGILYMPAGALRETVGAYAGWDEEAKAFSITTPKEYFDPFIEDNREGPLLHVAYPAGQRISYYGHSLFVFGTTESFAKVRVTVNGEPVELYDERTGNFLTMVEIPRGEEYQIVVEASNRYGSTAVTRSVIYPGPWQSMAVEPLTIHQSFQIPSEDQVLGPGEILRVAFQGSPGAEAFLRIGSGIEEIKMTELAYPGGPRGEGGIYIASYPIDEESLASMETLGPHELLVTLRNFEEEVNKTLPGRVVFSKSMPYRVIEVKEEHLLKNRGWLYRLSGGHYIIHSSTLGGAGSSTAAITYLVEGNRYETAGMSGSYYRINTSNGDTYMIHSDMVLVLEDSELIAPSLTGIKITGIEEYKTSLHVISDERYPFLVEDSKNGLVLKLYDVRVDEDLHIPLPGGGISEIGINSSQDKFPGIRELTIGLEAEMAGFRPYWVDDGLMIDFYWHSPVDHSAPLAGKRIIVDPGHGGEDPGAIGPGALQEKDVVLAISLYLEEILTDAGADVIMTRREDIFVNLYDRPEKIDQYNADLFISIHANAHAHDAPATEIHGIMTLYNYAHNENLAEIMLLKMHEETGVRAFRTWRRNIAVLRHPHVPSVLVEVGYLMHPEDNWFILHPVGQQKMAAAIKEGLAQYFLSTAPDAEVSRIP